MKREGRIHKGVSIGAYSILIAFMLLLLWTVLRYPGNHLIPWQMALGVAAATVLLLAAGAAWNKIYTVTGRKNSLYAVALVLFGVLLYVVSLSRQGNENTLLDYTYVYRDALNLANGRELEDTNYFLTYSNNLKPMLLLSVLFRMALLMDVSPFYFVLLRSVILVMLVACACGYLAERNGDTCWRFPILLAFVFLLPMWEMTAVFYTDSMSFGMGILGLAFLKLAAASRGKRRQTLWALLAAGMAVLAGTWKITVIIPLIACAVILLWQRVSVDRRVTLLFGGFVVILGVALQLWANSYEITKEASETANPVISWVALGMKEDGSWTNNTEFVDHMYEFSTRQEKQQYSMEYIRENRSEFWNPVHLRKKASYNFANGNLGGQCIFERGVQRWNPALGNVFALGKILLAHLSVLFLLSGVHVCAVTDRNDPQPSQYYQRSGTTCNVDDLSVGIYRYRCFFNVLGSQWKTDVQSDARNPAGKCSEYRVFLEKLITKTSKIIIDHYNAHVVHCIRYYSIVYRREVGTCAKN